MSGRSDHDPRLNTPRAQQTSFSATLVGLVGLVLIAIIVLSTLAWLLQHMPWP